MSQIPQPGSVLIHRCGDLFHLTLTHSNHELRPHIRTNLGGLQEAQQARIRLTERGQAYTANNWIDIPLDKGTEADTYSISLPLYEVGIFQAKLWFQSPEGGEITWGEGENMWIKVEPASTLLNNSIYGVFTRQFGPNKNKAFAAHENDEEIQRLEAKAYHIIPHSGTFREVIKELDHIMDHMGFRILQLLPIHPTPTTFARMGRFGSPYAALDFLNVNPALAEFDPQASPMDQFLELVHEVHRRKGEIFLDIPADHTGWASVLQKDHPEFFVRNEEGAFVSPGAWGTTWEDLIKLDFSKIAVHQSMAEVFLYWCRKGVDGFRCDAGYMIPFDAWEYIIAKVRMEFPNTIFLLEGLGGPTEVTERLLLKGTFSWAYSELFQNYSKAEVENYLRSSIRISEQKGALCHFSETHDNLRLAATSHTWSQMRNLLCALCAPAGGFGISNGVEFFAEERINVHQSSGLNWGNEKNLIGLMRRLSTLFKVHPAFWAGAKMEVLENDSEYTVSVLRTAYNGDQVLILLNLHCEESQPYTCPQSDRPTQEHYDLLSDTKFPLQGILNPGQGLCLDWNANYTEQMHKAPLQDAQHALEQQRRAETILKVYSHVQGFGKVSYQLVKQYQHLLQEDPFQFCLEMGASLGQIVPWDCQCDARRLVLATSESVLLIFHEHYFDFQLKQGERGIHKGHALQKTDQSFFALVPLAQNREEEAKKMQLSVRVNEKNTSRVETGEILLLPAQSRKKVRQSFSLEELKERNLVALCTSTSGAMAQIPGIWGSYHSKYDSFFAANLDPRVPVDRTSLISRWRCWVVYNDYSHELSAKSQSRFAADGSSRASWSFKAPCGQGHFVLLDIELTWSKDPESLGLHFIRRTCEHESNLLDAHIPIKVILRPDLEYRSNHEVSKAFTIGEAHFSNSIQASETGFSFDPYQRGALVVNAPQAHFTLENEWIYMHHLPVEENRGMEACTDFFSPGYFSFELKENTHQVLYAGIGTVDPTQHPLPAPLPTWATLEDVLLQSLQSFIVRRDEGLSVIAGYPWFLDWGRDTLICLRGIIFADLQLESKKIISIFALYEEQGTLPNMIRGKNASNRNTSDAPLWFIVAIQDYITHFQDTSILEEDCGGRTLKECMISIVKGYQKACPNGIQMDPASGLIYSPSHFTWMDTNYPAGTPRQGYPIEIQALWHKALSCMASIDASGEWKQLAQQVKENIVKYFYISSRDAYADCLHATQFETAEKASRDDACRPNQLFLITLGVITDAEQSVSILRATRSLVIPGAIRSLKDAPTQYAFPIYDKGKLLNDPHAPYWGHYWGSEDERRKPAYHNGTAWAWPFFSYCEALYLYSGDTRTSLALMNSAIPEMEKGVINHLPEIADGNWPHRQRGCLAQAWSITEYFRVKKIIT